MREEKEGSKWWVCRERGTREEKEEGKEDLKRGEAAVGRGRDGRVKTKEVVNMNLICVHTSSTNLEILKYK